MDKAELIERIVNLLDRVEDEKQLVYVGQEIKDLLVEEQLLIVS